MTRKVKINIALLGSVLIIGTLAAFLAWERNSLRNPQLRSKITRQSDGEVQSTTAFRDIGRFAVIEVGTVRLAFRGIPFDMEAGASVRLAGAPEGSRGGPTGSIRVNRLTWQATPQGTDFVCGGLPFKIERGKLKIAGLELDVLQQKKLVIVSLRNESVVVIPLEGSNEN